MLCEITASEIVEWEALYRIDPWGEDRADLRAAIVAYTFASAHTKKGKKLKLSDFMPDYDKAYAKQMGLRQSDQLFAGNLIAWHNRLGGEGEIPEDLALVALGAKRMGPN